MYVRIYTQGWQPYLGSYNLMLKENSKVLHCQEHLSMQNYEKQRNKQKWNNTTKLTPLRDFHVKEGIHDDS